MFLMVYKFKLYRHIPTYRLWILNLSIIPTCGLKKIRIHNLQPIFCGKYTPDDPHLPAPFTMPFGVRVRVMVAAGWDVAAAEALRDRLVQLQPRVTPRW